MGIAQRNDRYKYLEDRIEEQGGVEHLEESEEWFQLEGTGDGGLFDHPHWDKYMHRTRFFTASVHYDVVSAEEAEEEAYETDATGEDSIGDFPDLVRLGVSNIQVTLIRPMHHYDVDSEDFDWNDDLPPIHSIYVDERVDKE